MQQFLLQIDKSRVITQEALLDYSGISSEMINTGCKTLCGICFCHQNNIFNGSMMGDNGIPFLMQIAGSHDVTIVLEHYMDFPEKHFTAGEIMMGDKLLSQDDYDDAFSSWCAGGESHWQKA